MVKTNNAAATIRQMLNDWNNATEQQRQEALEMARRLAEAAAAR